MRQLEIFTWGYWGWGNHTSDLVKGVDAVEAKRGFAPPVFVDIRISRSVRARGFSGSAFEKLLGAQRHHHLRDMGNDAVLSGGTGIRIHNPAAAADLLEKAIEADGENRRILFFCACEFPIGCHRWVAGDLLLREALTHDVRLVIDEWPGGESRELSVSVPLSVLKQVRKGRKSVLLPAGSELAEYAALPWGSAVEVNCGDSSSWVVSGPAKASDGKWWLPVLSDTVFDSGAAALKAGLEFRSAHGFGRRDSRR